MSDLLILKDISGPSEPLLGNVYPQLGKDSGFVDELLGWSASLACVYLFASPVATMKTIAAARSTMDFSDVPYVVSMLNCAAWIAYASFTPGRLQPLVINLFGVTVEALFLAVFFWFHTAKARKLLLVKVLAVLLIMAVAVFVAGLLRQNNQPKEHATTFLGVLGDVVNLAMYASPLSVVSTVLQTQSVEFMPLGLSLGTFLASILWSSYALWVGDPYIAVPNHLGLLLGVLQLSIYFKYSRMQPSATVLQAAPSQGLPLPATADTQPQPQNIPLRKEK